MDVCNLKQAKVDFFTGKSGIIIEELGCDMGDPSYHPSENVENIHSDSEGISKMFLHKVNRNRSPTDDEPNSMSSMNLAPGTVILGYEEFTEDLVDFFRSHRDGTSHNCAMVMQDSKVRFCPYFRNDKYAEIFFEVLFSYFEITLCTEYDVTCRALKDYIHCDLCAFEWKRFSPLFMSPSDCYPLDIIDRVADILLPLDLKFTGRILRYGAPFEICSGEYPFHMWNVISEILKRLELDLEDEFESGNMVVSSETFYSHYSNCTSRRQRRLYIVFLVLYKTLERKKADKYPMTIMWNSLRCLKLVFQAVEEPFVTVSEISRLLNRALRDGESKDRVIEDFCKYLVEEFPNAEGCVTPRSLLHLSRCQIRERMGKSRTLPNGVWSLEIPDRLKDYILIQTKREEFYPKYVAALAATNNSASEESPSKK